MELNNLGVKYNYIFIVYQVDGSVMVPFIQNKNKYVCFY